MTSLTLAPAFSISDNRIRGCTPWLARLLTLFSYGRCLSVNKRLGHLIIVTRRNWFSREMRVINFDQISHIVYDAQALPSLAPWRYLTAQDPLAAGWAFFFVALVLKGKSEEIQLFTLWQAQPREPDWLDRLAGNGAESQDLGDESARAFIVALKEMTGAPISAQRSAKFKH